MQLLRSILKMYCSQHLPLQSNVLVIDAVSFVVKPPVHTTFKPLWLIYWASWLVVIDAFYVVLFGFSLYQSEENI